MYIHNYIYMCIHTHLCKLKTSQVTYNFYILSCTEVVFIADFQPKIILKLYTWTLALIGHYEVYIQ